MREPYYKTAIKEEARRYWQRRNDKELPEMFRGFLILYSSGKEAEAECAKAFLLAQLVLAKPKEVTEIVEHNVDLVRKPYPCPKELGRYFHFDLEGLAQYDKPKSESRPVPQSA